MHTIYLLVLSQVRHEIYDVYCSHVRIHRQSHCPSILKYLLLFVPLQLAAAVDGVVAAAFWGAAAGVQAMAQPYSFDLSHGKELAGIEDGGIYIFRTEPLPLLGYRFHNDKHRRLCERVM